MNVSLFFVRDRFFFKFFFLLQDLLDVIKSTKLLKEAQAKEDSAEAKATLPTLSVADLDRKIKNIPIEITTVQGVKIVKHDIPSSGEEKLINDRTRVL